MSSFYVNGLGESTGDALVTVAPVFTGGSNRVWWVKSSIGTDAVSPAGTNREKPLATLQQAVTNSISGDIIVLESGHSESLAGTVTINAKALTIVGGGSVTDDTAATIGFGAAGQLSYTGGSPVILRNIKFTSRSAAGATARINSAAGGGAYVYGCRFECGANDTGSALALATPDVHSMIRGTTVVSTATSTASQPQAGIVVTGTALYLHILDCVFNDGAVGFASPYSLDLSAAAQTGLMLENNSLLHGADIVVNPSSTGWHAGTVGTGGGKVIW